MKILSVIFILCLVVYSIATRKKPAESAGTLGFNADNTFGVPRKAQQKTRSKKE